MTVLPRPCSLGYSYRRRTQDTKYCYPDSAGFASPFSHDLPVPATSFKLSKVYSLVPAGAVRKRTAMRIFSHFACGVSPEERSLPPTKPKRAAMAETNCLKPLSTFNAICKIAQLAKGPTRRVPLVALDAARRTVENGAFTAPAVDHPEPGAVTLPIAL